MIWKTSAMCKSVHWLEWQVQIKSSSGYQEKTDWSSELRKREQKGADEGSEANAEVWNDSFHFHLWLSKDWWQLVDKQNKESPDPIYTQHMSVISLGIKLLFLHLILRFISKEKLRTNPNFIYLGELKAWNNESEKCI